MMRWPAPRPRSAPTATIELPEVERARAAAYLISMAEGASLHLDRLRERPLDFDPAVRERLLAGAVLPGSWIVKAQKFRRWYRDRVLEIMADWDVLIAPATPVPAPEIGQKSFVLDGKEMLVRPNIGIYTQPISFIGLPVVAAPIPTPGNCRSRCSSSPRRGARMRRSGRRRRWKRPGWRTRRRRWCEAASCVSILRGSLRCTSG